MPLSVDLLPDVSSTALLTLLGRARGSSDDPEGARLAEAVRSALARSPRAAHQRLAGRSISRRLAQYLVRRARHFDAHARRFAAAEPDALVVNLAAGLDTRFHRLGGTVEIVDVDSRR